MLFATRMSVVQALTTTTSSTFTRRFGIIYKSSSNNYHRCQHSTTANTKIQPFIKTHRSSTTNTATTTAVAATCLLVLSATSTVNGDAYNNNNHININNNLNIASCTTSTENKTSSLYFHPDMLEYDHYNGVTVHFERFNNNNSNDSSAPTTDFQHALEEQLNIWKQQGKCGIWLHIPVDHVDKVAIATSLGFDFHLIIEQTKPKRNVLVLSKWIDVTTTNRLPHGPTHQVGVGCLIFHPADNDIENPEQRRMLVVQEKTGPASVYNLYKMPTGLADPDEDIHDAAIRELYEETGLSATFDGILLFRQAHTTKPNTNNSRNVDVNNNKDKNKKTVISRKASDLFFVCQMQLQIPEEDKNYINDDQYWIKKFNACPTEIASISWMTVSDYCKQNRWQTSPAYIKLNNAILYASKHALFNNYTLPLQNGTNVMTNTIYMNEP